MVGCGIADEYRGICETTTELRDLRGAMPMRSGHRAFTLTQLADQRRRPLDDRPAPGLPSTRSCVRRAQGAVGSLRMIALPDDSRLVLVVRVADAVIVFDALVTVIM